jgi:hypothetical protein
MLMVELVTPCSVAPVACPLPHGDGSVPNDVVDDDVAPLVAGERNTPVAMSEVSNRAAPAARVPVILAMAEPPSARGLLRLISPQKQNRCYVLGTIPTRHPEISAPRICL